jgi:hypothetical protein
MVQQPVAQLPRARAKTAMPRSPHIPIGIPTGLPERLSEFETRIRVRAAFAVKGFGPRNPDRAHTWPDPAIFERLMAKLPWGYTTRVLGWVKGRHRGPGRS